MVWPGLPWSRRSVFSREISRWIPSARSGETIGGMLARNNKNLIFFADFKKYMFTQWMKHSGALPVRVHSKETTEE